MGFLKGHGECSGPNDSDGIDLASTKTRKVEQVKGHYEGSMALLYIDYSNLEDVIFLGGRWLRPCRFVLVLRHYSQLAIEPGIDVSSSPSL